MFGRKKGPKEDAPAPAQAEPVLGKVNTKPIKELGEEVNVLDEVLETEVRPFLDLIDSLREFGIQDEVSLPQIAVMGDQSCGKSSVLEALSGIQFPRGSGLVTRCPVQLVMKRGKKGTPWQGRATVSWAGKEQPGGSGVVSSPDKMRAVIEELMNELCAGAANGFSHDSICVQVTSPDCPDLTLIDLPGIVRTAVSGQTTGVMSEVNGLIEGFLERERTIVLAIVPANQDVATVDILERAKRVDPEGDRTIGVLTKPDLIGPGNEEEVLQTLTNKRKYLKLGYVMVKNRNQQQLSKGMSLEEAHQEELSFFKNHGVFSDVDPSLLGIKSLTDRLVALLLTRIKTALPNMKWEMQENLAYVEKELHPLERNLPRTPIDRIKGLMQIVTEFTRLLRSSIQGEYKDAVLNSSPDLRIRSMVDRSFRELQHQLSSLNPGFEHPDFPKVLQDELRAHRGRELCGIVNSQFFYVFMLQQVEMFRPQVEKCRNDCCNFVLNVGNRLISQVSPQYPGLVERFQEVVSEMVDETAEKLQPELDQLFDKERNPFTENQDLVEAMNRVRFERFDRVLHQVMIEAGDEPEGGGDASDTSELKEWVLDNLGTWYRYSHGANATSKVEDMSTILQAYWRVSSKRVCSNACMLLETNLLAEVTNQLETHLLTLTQTMSEEAVMALFQEDAALASRREKLSGRRSRLRAALKEVDTIAPEVVAMSKRQAKRSGSGSASDSTPTSEFSSPDNVLRKPKPAWITSSESAPIGGTVRSAATMGGSAGLSASPSPSPSSKPLRKRFGGRGSALSSGSADSLVFKSQPEKASEAAQDGSFATFVYTRDGDNGGLIYWLGTRKHSRKFDNPALSGLVAVTSSGMQQGSEASLVSRKRRPTCTTDKPDAWLCIDVGNKQSLCVTNYSLCNGSDREGSDLVNWVLEGYDDSIRMWIILTHTRAAGPSPVLPSPYGVGSWPVDSMGKSFRFIRVRSTGPNGSAGHALPICAIELYGKLWCEPEL